MAKVTIVSNRDKHPEIVSGVWIVLTLMLAALVTRANRFGDPAIQMDEQFYLLVADRMWHGVLPYVDLWDRKPILLFLIYAVLRPLSSDGIMAYQIGAAFFATATAFFIVLIATRFANLRGAWLAGISYLLYLPLLEGAGGQSPIFYNLFMAIGAWEVLRAEEAMDEGGIVRHGSRAVLWAGLAIQVKYTAAIEGCAYGLWLSLILARRNYGSPSRIFRQVTLWGFIALVPTLLAAGFYTVIGHGEDFVKANFVSIFLKHDPENVSEIGFLWRTGIRLMPLLVVAGFSIPILISRRKALGAPGLFLLLWTCFAILGFFAIGNYYGHYALPLIVPVIIACAPLLGTLVGGVAGMAILGWAAIIVTGFPFDKARETNERRIDAMVEAVKPYAARGCIYVNDGPSILYLLTRSCLPSRYVFPSHLADASEAQATDATPSMAALLASRPSAVFVPDTPPRPERNAVTAAMLDAALADNYQRVAIFPDVFPVRNLILYARKDLLPLETQSPAGEKQP